jgi:hypothetical protein
MVNPLKVESQIRSLQANLDKIRQIANVDQPTFECDKELKPTQDPHASFEKF